MEGYRQETAKKLGRSIDDITQGDVLWLPESDILPVSQAHGKGPVEKGIYNHPVVVVSRPLGHSHTVHFYLVSATL
jgi:hypothetical protein